MRVDSQCVISIDGGVIQIVASYMEMSGSLLRHPGSFARHIICNMCFLHVFFDVFARLPVCSSRPHDLRKCKQSSWSKKPILDSVGQGLRVFSSLVEPVDVQELCAQRLESI